MALKPAATNESSIQQDDDQEQQQQQEDQQQQQMVYEDDEDDDQEVESNLSDYMDDEEEDDFDEDDDDEYLESDDDDADGKKKKKVEGGEGTSESTVINRIYIPNVTNLEEDEDDNDDDGRSASNTTTTTASTSVGKKRSRDELKGKQRQRQQNQRQNPIELQCDLSVYRMFHQLKTIAPCLSFDIIPDNYGSGPERADTYPQAGFLIGGTQANKVAQNRLMILKLSNMGPVRLRKNKKNKNDNDEDSDDSDDSDDEEEDDDPKSTPQMEYVTFPVNGTINRVRVTKLDEHQYVAATWSELGVVQIWNLQEPLAKLHHEENVLPNKTDYHHHVRINEKRELKSLYTFTGHTNEGYALDWSTVVQGSLATGDNDRRIYLWRMANATGWTVDQLPLVGHKDSVEDLQWSPNESTILASCSADRTIRVWDTRVPRSRGSVITIDDAHTTDVNVISWNRLEKAFLLSGGDDAMVKVWDLRQFRTKTPGSGGGGSTQAMATFKHHVAPITSVEWHPTDSTMFGASSEDNQITLWDLSVECDPDAQQEVDNVVTVDDDEVEKLPPHLMFLHTGQCEVKELHWHPQSPGVVYSTANSGCDIFRTISI